jgi:single-stranded-DNA-specific exonuclease
MHHYLPVLQTSQRQGQPLELMFSIQENTWRGTTTMQLRAYDLRLEE